MRKGRHRKKNVVRRRGSAVVAAGVMTATAGAAVFAGASPASAASTIVSDSQIAAYAHSAGLDSCRVGLATWVAIALAESSGNRYAHATVGEDSRGLWQINMRAHAGWVGSRDLYDPATNAWAATQVCKGSGPSAWTTYTKGAYRAYLARGNAAANAVGSGAVLAAPVSLAKAPAIPANAWYLSQAANHATYLDAVRQLQQKLASLGYTVGVDGYFGPQTNGVVRAYQASHGLLVDGVVGPQTHKALFG
ncbi:MULTISPECIES: peptidoglycan-binding protein [unclassified Pseudofrankia]|uniref:peptidoglycan-binding protein n=1 Tax=unclassified Pseudofrankia TaxID=2994372 RepID=UPI0008D99479|nr:MULTISPECIES: peptidoglycan-binding protein [unclassified Pseudofrankia]MDT3444335.1 peptidoglycan-binding protein [Pseudofrankia sp. BMG5.37]OHV43340.1 peptidoglycan-binding protein [Pseudofrankia sp. BMG5.36]